MLKEKVLELLESKGIILFTEQSKSRYDAEQKVVSLSIQINSHILKCLIYGPNCEALNHWYREISNWFYEIDFITLKPNNNEIPLKDLINWSTQNICISNILNKNKFDKLIRYSLKNKEYDYTPGLNLVNLKYQKVFELIKKIYINSKDNENYIEDACNEWFREYKDAYKKD